MFSFATKKMLNIFQMMENPLKYVILFLEIEELYTFLSKHI